MQLSAETGKVKKGVRKKWGRREKKILTRGETLKTPKKRPTGIEQKTRGERKRKKKNKV